MKSSRITVITPTYNRANMLPEVIKSLQKQTLQNFDHIIIDDGSADNTKDIITPLIKNNKNTQYIYQENAGEAAAVNVGWSLAQTDYVVIVNSDDPQPSNLLETIVEFMDKHPDVAIGYPDWFKIDKNSKVVESVKCMDYDRNTILLHGYCIPGPGAVLRRSALTEIPQIRDGRFPTVTDLGCWLVCAAHQKHFKRIPKFVSNWRSHDEGITLALKGHKIAKDLYDLYKTFWTENNHAEINHLKRQSMANISLLCVAKTLTAPNKKYLSISYLLKAFCWSPSGTLINIFNRLRKKRYAS